MSKHGKISAAPDQVVTSSDLVRQFGLWQDRAARAPVFILHRGRPRLVLTSVDVMDALCAPHDRQDSGAHAQLDALLDGVDCPAVLADGAARIVAIGRAARALFPVAVGDEVTALSTEDPFLALALYRVAETRTAETIEIRRAGRRYDCAIEPYPGGIALFLSDVTDSARGREAAAELAALRGAANADGGLGIAQIGLRGYIETPCPGLVRLTGIARESLVDARLTSLLTVDTRVGAGEALERAARGEAQAVDATVIVNRADPRPVRLALSPIMGPHGVAGVTALFRAR